MKSDAKRGVAGLFGFVLSVWGFFGAILPFLENDDRPLHSLYRAIYRLINLSMDFEHPAIAGKAMTLLLPFVAFMVGIRLIYWAVTD